MINDLALEKTVFATVTSDAILGTEVTANLMVEGLNDIDFYNQNHIELFNLIKFAVLEKKIPPTPINLINLGCSDPLKKVIYELDAAATFSDIAPFIKRLKTIAKIRRLEQASLSIPIQLLEAHQDPAPKTLDDAYSTAESNLLKILNETVAEDSGFLIKDKLAEFFENLHQKIKDKKTAGFPTGITKLDELTGGLRRGENVIIAARPSMGKTSLALLIALTFMLNGFRVAYISLEMTKEEIYNTLYSMLSEMVEGPIIKYHSLRNPYGHQTILKRLSELTHYFMNDLFYVNFTPGITMNEIKSIARDLKYKGGLDLLITDHLGRMVKNRRDEYVELTQYSSDQKDIALELDLVALPLVQLKRGAEKAGVPSMSELKGTGALEEDANLILFPWRPYVINKNDNDPHEALLITGKARNDDIPDINLHFSTDTKLFSYKPPEDHDRF